MKISLIGPKWNEMVNSYPPLGLGYLAAMAEQDGHEVRIHDFGLHPETSIEDDMKEVIAFKPDLIGYTSMTTSHHSIELSAQIARDVLGCPILIGGPHATSLPEQTINSPLFDYMITGEGELSFQDFLRTLSTADHRWERVDGLWWKDDGKVVRNREQHLPEDLDVFPFPARHLYNLRDYPLYAPTGEPMVTVLTSRGCPYNCSFCFKGIVGRTYRQRSPQNIVAELDQLMKDYQVRNFYFIDDLFTIDVRRLEHILDYFIDQKIDVRWRCLARVDRVKPALLRKMFKAGCRQIHYGIESGNEAILKETAKHIDLSQVRQAIEWTEDAGIAAKGYFILGLPGDTEETMNETIEFAASLNLTEAMFSIATPMPGTRLWDELVRQRPGTEYNAEFQKSYYYNSYMAEIAPFMNVSKVSDKALSAMAIKARKRFLQEKKRRIYQKSFGPKLGDVLYKASDATPLRKIGRSLMNMGLFGRYRRVQRFSEAQQWG